MANTVDAPIAPAQEKASLFEDFIDILFTPSKVYARRANSGFWAVTLIVTVLVGGILLASSGAMEGIIDAEYERATAKMMEQNPNMTAEQLEAGRGVAATIGKVVIFVMMPIVVLVVGLITWLVGKMFGAALSYTAAAMIVAYAYIPQVLASILVAVQGLVIDTSTMRGRFDLSLGVGRFLDADTTSPGLLALVGRIDLFTIWVTILIGIGIAVVGKLPRSQAMLAAAVIWVVGALPAVWQLVMG